MRELVVHQLLEQTLATRPETLVVSGPKRLSYQAFYLRVLRLADSLRSLGIKKGSVVGVMDINSHRYLELQYALSMRGATIHPLNFRLPPDDLLYTIQQAGDDWLFVWRGFGEAAVHLQKHSKRFIWLEEDPEDSGNYEGLVRTGREVEDPDASTVHEDDPYTLLYTTGTTGKPKGIQYRHRDLLLASLQIAHHLALHKGGARISTRDVFMPLIPFFHIHAWGAAFFVPYLGAKLVLPEQAEPAEQLELIKREGVSWSNMVPTQLHMLLSKAESPLTGLKVLTGGSSLPRGLAEKATSLGIRFSLIYGGSDQLGTSISVVPEDTEPESPEAAERLRTRTRPLMMVDLQVQDKTGKQVPADGRTIGEVWVKSPWLPAGYYQNPHRSAEAFREGWFISGDLAVRFPDGSFYVVDREKDAIKSGGEWIPSGVLESVISEHPQVVAAAVLASPDERWGERPLAVIQAEGPLTQEELVVHLENAVQEGRLARFWLPDRYVFVDKIPLTSAGKLSKAKLLETLGLSN